MKVRHFLVVTLLIVICPGLMCHAQIIIATETENGTYAGGKYKSSPPEYISTFVLLDREKRLVRTQLVRINTGDVIADISEYKILTEEILGDDSPGHPKQRVFTAVGTPGTQAVEMLQIGETFFNYCKSSFDALFTAHGTIKKSISSEENIMRLLKNSKRDK
jgi:hypothetical protein